MSATHITKENKNTDTRNKLQLGNKVTIYNIAHITALNINITNVSITRNISVQSAKTDTSAVEITNKPQNDGGLRNLMTHQNNGVAKLRCPREVTRKWLRKYKIYIWKYEILK